MEAPTTGSAVSQAGSSNGPRSMNPLHEVDRLRRMGDEAESRQRHGKRDGQEHRQDEKEGRNRVPATEAVPDPAEGGPGRQAKDGREEDRGEERPDDRGSRR